MQKCLIPAQNINWRLRLESRETFEKVDYFHMLEGALLTFISCSKEFISIYQINQKLSIDYPKLKEFSEHFFISQLESIKKQVSILIDQIKENEQYSKSKELIENSKRLKIALEVVNEKLEIIKNIHDIENLAEKNPL